MCFLLRHIILLFVLSSYVDAQNLVSNVEHYSIKDGLSNPHVSSIIQDKRGYLWIGTAWGLNRYDGITFKKYITIGKNALPDLDVRSLVEAPDGKIWMTAGNAICSFDPLTENFKTYFSGNGPQTIYIDKQRRFWTGSIKGLMHLDSEIKPIHQSTTFLGDKKTNVYISDFLEDRKGRFWLSTSVGVKLFDRNTYSFIANSEPSIATTHIFEDNRGDIYCGTWNNGLMKWNRSKSKFDHISFKNLRGDEHTVSRIHEININGERRLMLGTFNGIALVNPDKTINNTLITEQVLNDELEQLSDTYISCIYKDKQGIYWIAGSNGLYKIDPAKQNSKWIQVARNQILFHIIHDKKDPVGTAYLTSFNGWYKMNLASNSVSKWELPSLHKESLSNINSYVATDSGYWFTSQKGFGFYDLYNNKAKDLSYVLMKDGVEGNRTGILLSDKKGRLWFSRFKAGLRMFDPQNKTIIQLLNDSTVSSLYGNYIHGTAIFNNNIVISAGTTCFVINTDDLSYRSYPINDNTFLLKDKFNRLFLIDDRTIKEFRQDEIHTIKASTPASALPIERVVQDSSGNFWVLTINGLYKTDSNFNNWISYSKKTGINSTIGVTEMKVIANKLLITTNVGRVLIHDLSESRSAYNSSNISISRISTGNKHYHFPNVHTADITAPYKSSVEIELSHLNFSDAEDHTIQYRLNGWNEEWQEVTAGKIRFEGLPGGNYTLYIKASNANTVFAESKLSFSIAFPFWQTWWFVGSIVLLIASVFYAWYKFRLQQAIKIERLRMRIASDLHDDIGATLSSISMYSESIKKQVKEKLPQLEKVMDKIGENSREMVSSMSDIVWAVNPLNDNGQKLLERIESYAKDTCSAKEIKLHFTSDAEVAAVNFSLEQRKNIYLIFKETINNALKYSGAQNIWISISKRSGQLHLVVKDDGSGFDAAKEFIGNGLKNLQARAKEINAGLQVISAFQKGTTIQLHCPIS